MTTPTEASSATQRHSEVLQGEVLQGKVLPIDSMSLDVERALHGSSHCGLRGVRCQFVDGSVTLSGVVVSYYLKQIAQTIVGRLPHVRRVHNQLRVVGFDKAHRDR